MRQALRRYAFPMMIIAAVLAAALPLNCFAVDSSAIVSDFAYNVLGAFLFNYYQVPSFNFYDTGYYNFLTSSFDNTNHSSSYISLSARCLFVPKNTGNALAGNSFYFYIPLFLNDLNSIDFDVYIGLRDQINANLVYNITLDSAVIIDPSSYSIDASISSSDEWYCFTDDEPIEIYMDKYNISYSSSGFFDVSYLMLKFDVASDAYFQSDFEISVGVSNSSSVSTSSANVAALTKSLSIIQSTLSNYISSDLQINMEILAYLEAIADYFNSTDSGSSESEDILADGEEKQQELEQLGDALSNVPKPSIENITQSFDPADTMISADPSMVQNALSIVYSWDKFLILLGLFIAVGTISYIIFGKKS